MAVSDDFVDYILDLLFDWNEVSPRRMFGGVGLFSYGKMFALVSDDVLYLKVDKYTKERYIAEGMKPFKPFPNRPTLMSYYELPPDVLEDSHELMKWAEEALEIQLK